MRKSILLFKRLQFINIKTVSTKISASILLGCFLIVSCALKSEDNDNWGFSLDTLIKKFSSNDLEKIELFVRDQKSNLGKFGYLLATSCDQKKKENYKQKWIFPIDTKFGIFEAQVTIPQQATNESITVEIENSKFSIDHNSTIPKLDITNICKNWNADSSKKIWITQNEIKNSAEKILKLIAPDCTFAATTPKGWQCNLNESSAYKTSQTLTKLQKRIIRKWSRQPYLFTRRLAISQRFSKAVGKNNKDSLRKLCKTLKNSDSSELPLIMANNRWQKAACYTNMSQKNRDAVIRIALAGATKELEYLHQTVEKTSRIGILQVKIPRSEAPSKNLWVSLTPIDSKVTDKKNTTQTAKNMIFSSTEHYQPCWHPVFSTNKRQMKDASELGLFNSSNSKCLSLGENLETIDSNYIEISIVGETEFLVTNGNSKILRLPLGQYKYVAHELPINVREWVPSPKDKTTEGIISWHSRRPRPVIKKW